MATNAGLSGGRSARFPHRSMTSALSAAALTACLGLLSARAAPSPDDESFEFRKGTRWTYVGEQNGSKKTVVEEVLQVSTEDLVVTGEPATVFHLAIRTLNVETGRFELNMTTAYLALEGGFLVTGSREGPPIRIYKLDSRKGDSWPCIDARLTKLSDLVFTHLGEEEITVPAGTFRNARHIQVEFQTEGSRHVGDVYIVPGVGIVKSRTVTEANGEKKSAFLELQKFSPPREF